MRLAVITAQFWSDLFGQSTYKYCQTVPCKSQWPT